MTFASRNVRWALVAYGLLAVLILGGVTWGTILTSKVADLQQKQTNIVHENDFNNTINSAAQRMENLFSFTLLSEASRQYYDYSTYSNPTLYHLDGTKVAVDTYVQPSPLINQELDPWIRLHFQVHSDGIWQSPQVSSGERFSTGAEIPIIDRILSVERAGALARLQQSVTYEQLVAKRSAYSQWAYGRDHAITEPTNCIATICLKPRHQEYRHRAKNLRDAQLRLVPPELCEEPAIKQDNGLDHSREGIPDDPHIRLTLSPMSAIWLDPDESGREQLVLLRSVSTDIQGWDAIQGVLLDWDILKRRLLEEAGNDLPPDADLVAVRDEDAAKHKWLLAMLPAAIEVPPLTASQLPRASTFTLIGVVWCAAVAILGGVGLGIRNVLALAERRTQFAYAVTHELRTPLTTLRLYSDMLAGGLVKPADRDRYVQTMNAESERLSDLVDEVLEYARVENHKVTLDVQPVTVAGLLEAVREHCEDRCTKAGKELVLEVNGLAEKTIHTDPQLVRQVVANLVDNACKHSRDAEDPTITVRALQQHGNRVSIDIEDAGHGIDAGQRHLIFKPFRRGRDNDTRRPGGIGLGLALARSWSQLLNGKLELVNTQAGATGACFRLTIPASR